ncbi:PTS transporter subunit EIIC [Thorsellia anophelis]|uniref:PTS system IIB component, Glc family (TC 4.A.1)/PTS system IIC component, Glc family (TC 4.A.1) n=1 Tax=Thorsellia anophelis DSM 18579 TaxID=1123402 RepID=A0A1I0BPK4_9GAMM|nr:PTS transporter subunit EIIC [Thorsellia anophelis]SET08243.1 PTS system IIB component, Glc family (TC 4.A.1)/PTS system IIC component, Glc family (TC 4.A.1) [Thorsellia anophelis DSM 18579]
MNIFATLQRIGRAFMLPIAVLPMAGILLGVGGAFTSGPLIETYQLTFLQDGTILNRILKLCFNAGLFVFANLPLLFAIGVGIGMANRNKETAALAAVIGFLLYHTVISTVLGFQGLTPDSTSIDALTKAGISPDTAVGLAALYTKELGIFTLQTGVFGGIMCGFLSAYITNRFSEVQLPDYLAFFSGNRLIPVITMIFFIPLGLLMPFIWPPIFKAIVFSGEAFSSMGYIGTFLYGTLMRLLNVFGLHHAIYPLFWYTELGGVMEVGGQVVSGGQKIFFAQLADPETIKFSSEATRTMTGGFLPMMFGLPAAALAMYHCADSKNRSRIKGIFLSAALTSFLTGITEPIEFTFLFVAPVLYGIHAVLEGIAYMLMHILDVAVGITFSRGLIDFTFFGLLQGTEKTSYHWILILGPIYSIIYYFLFKTIILKFNISTPGRNDTDAKLYTRKDFDEKEKSKKPQSKGNKPLIELIVSQLGGIENIKSIDACITRLRVTIHNQSLVTDEASWKAIGAKGIFRSGNAVQIIFGTQAETYKNQIIAKYQIS